MPSKPSEPWCKIEEADGTVTSVPRRYRIPLLFAQKFLWESLRLAFCPTLPSPKAKVAEGGEGDTSTSTEVEKDGDREDDTWSSIPTKSLLTTSTDDFDQTKHGILHLSRLCTRFLSDARENLASRKAKGKGTDRRWRNATFDRVLTRYKYHYMENHDEELREFWMTSTNPVKEYEEDILHYDWKRWSMRGYAGIHLTESEIKDGISLSESTAGLHLSPEGTGYEWDLDEFARVHGVVMVASTSGKKGWLVVKKEEGEVDLTFDDDLPLPAPPPVPPPAREERERQEEEGEKEQEAPIPDSASASGLNNVELASTLTTSSAPTSDDEADPILLPLTGCSQKKKRKAQTRTMRMIKTGVGPAGVGLAEVEGGPGAVLVPVRHGGVAGVVAEEGEEGVGEGGVLVREGWERELCMLVLRLPLMLRMRG
ncbi:hypothetical protein BDQ17DRAFT_690179 [Cyathus striatus]|nr:hypothetical protein BDQ17DRAFT_690179 [Cyathus striatus]